MKVGQRVTCLFCLQESSLELRLDKLNRPYFICIGGCGARCFLRGDISLRGPSILWGPLTIAMRNNEAEVAQVLVNRAVEKVRDANENANHSA